MSLPWMLGHVAAATTLEHTQMGVGRDVIFIENDCFGRLGHGSGRRFPPKGLFRTSGTWSRTSFSLKIICIVRCGHYGPEEAPRTDLQTVRHACNVRWLHFGAIPPKAMCADAKPVCMRYSSQQSKLLARVPLGVRESGVRFREPVPAKQKCIPGSTPALGFTKHLQ